MAPVKARCLYITTPVGGPLESRVGYLHISVSFRGPFKEVQKQSTSTFQWLFGAPLKERYLHISLQLLLGGSLKARNFTLQLLLGPLWKQGAYTLKLLLGSPLKSRCLHITVVVRGAFKSIALAHYSCFPWSLEIKALTHCNCWWWPFESKVLTHYNCCWGPLWTQGANQRWARIRTGSGLKPILAGSGMDRTTFLFKIGGSGLDRTENIFVVSMWLSWKYRK